MDITDQLQLTFHSQNEAQIFYKSFIPEVASMPMKRSTWHISPPDEHGRISIHITAKDAIAYRATINSVIQMAYLVEKTISIIESHSIV